MESTSWTDERLDDAIARIESRFDRVDREFDRVYTRLDRIDGRLDDVQRQLAQIGWGVAAVFVAQAVAGMVAALIALL